MQNEGPDLQTMLAVGQDLWKAKTMACPRHGVNLFETEIIQDLLVALEHVVDMAVDHCVLSDWGVREEEVLFYVLPITFAKNKKLIDQASHNK